jgi:hypothetical protein
MIGLAPGDGHRPCLQTWRCVTGSTYPPALINFLALSRGITVAIAQADSVYHEAELKKDSSIFVKSRTEFWEIDDVIHYFYCPSATIVSLDYQPLPVQN